jgi:heme-degrading monooxygenase HmoA/ketosteroid isomerase-like protein
MRIRAGNMREVEMYVILWEFEVRPEKVASFVAAYGPDGIWAQLFTQADGFVGTELLRSTDSEDGSRFLTIDRWQTAEYFARFQTQFATQYGRLDTQCERLAFKESKLGALANPVQDERGRWEIAMEDEIELLNFVYSRFNARDMEAVLAALHEDVVWENGMEGGHLQGRDAVRSYWTRQWATRDPHVEPVRFSKGPEGEIVVEVHQIVHDTKGSLLLDQNVGHIFKIEDGAIRRFDIRDA